MRKLLLEDILKAKHGGASSSHTFFCGEKNAERKTMKEKNVAINGTEHMITKEWLAGKKVTVFGLGVNSGGVGTVKYLSSLGVSEIVVTDKKSESELSVSMRELSTLPNIQYVLGEHRVRDFTETDIVVKNPAIPWTNEFAQAAIEKGIPVETDSSLFFRFCENKILGVTGTKGKTTTASMLAHILEASGVSTVRAGIGDISVLDTLLRLQKDDVVVFELSSWRLSGLSYAKKSPDIAVLTNIYPDHLNYYPSMEVYAADKENIFRFQTDTGVLVANADNEWTSDMTKRALGKKILFSASPLEQGFFLRSGKAILRDDTGLETEWFDCSELPVPGTHNEMNALAAAAAAHAFGLSREQIAFGLKTFRGVSHRLEFVGKKRGVRWYNDSAATIPEAAIASISALKDPVVLIAGGSDKNLDFSSLADTILSKTKDVILFSGEGTEKLLSTLKERAPDRHIDTVSSMPEAIEKALQKTAPGDLVLLSPGAASFGLFRNEFDRGDQFREYVKKLPE